MQLAKKQVSTGQRKYIAPRVLIDPNKPCLRIFTDGSCLKNPGGPGTYSFVVVENDVALYEYGEHYINTTNNRMELMAVMNAIEYIANTPYTGQIVIYSDSQYVCNSIHNKKGKEANKNGDLLEVIKKSAMENPHIQYLWTKGHAGSRWNEYADKLCKTTYNKPSMIDGGYDNALYTSDTTKTNSSMNAKRFLLSKYLPNTSEEEKELWYKCSDWARTITGIMDQYKNSK